MAIDNESFSETSPLLTKADDDFPKPNDALNRGLPPRVEGNGHANGSSKPAEDVQEPDAKDRHGQHEGMPEVKKQFKFIVPAIAIGVSDSVSTGTVNLLIDLRSDDNRQQLWQDRERSQRAKQDFLDRNQVSERAVFNAQSNTSFSYFLTLTTFQPLYGKLSDIFGRKPALLFGYAVFGTGYNVPMVEIRSGADNGQMFAGIGGGGMTTVVSILMSDVVPLRERGVWQGVINIIYAFGAGCGAPLGMVDVDGLSSGKLHYVSSPSLLSPSRSSFRKEKIAIGESNSAE
ncbi:MAG: hypothetical protein Q9191_001753 [Dirinaria sp. TL-2023a]